MKENFEHNFIAVIAYIFPYNNIRLGHFTICEQHTFRSFYYL